ncbi:hypothetical protein, partial [Actinomadura sp. BRA 177]|uniref:hypothetical protein n=1 Tax=Actinomadura sp. BRA 177 TaxID=2745202 RepID=UPI001C3D05BC
MSNSPEHGGEDHYQAREQQLAAAVVQVHHSSPSGSPDGRPTGRSQNGIDGPSSEPPRPHSGGAVPYTQL